MEPYRSEWVDSKRSYTRLAAIAWKLLMDSYERASQGLLPQRYLEVRYEDFLEDPRETVESILSFTGLPWTPDFETHFHKQEINRSRSTAFERDFSPEQLTEVEDSLSEKLVKYGYATGHEGLRVLR